MATHTIAPERRTLHGTFSRDDDPVLVIEPGDTVRFQTLVAGWWLEPETASGEERRRFEPRDPERDRGHPLCGPVAIRGAEPGMTLEVRIGELRVGRWGWTGAGGFASQINERLGVVDQRASLNWVLDPDELTGRDQHGHTVQLSPFLGVIGMPPDEPGIHPTAPPRATGGNIDCKELVSGSILYLPIAIPGGLVSVGDGHALQGDGEVSLTAIECPMEVAELTFNLRDDLHLTMPRAHTPAGWITFGFDEDLNEATAIALEGMIDLMQEMHGLNRLDALALASVLVDLRITQIVNGVRGVHAVLPHGALG